MLFRSRFALSCSPAMLAECRALLRAHPGLRLQTHINENHEEIRATADQFPRAANYLDVYDGAGLLTERSVLAHNIHADDDELRRLAASGAAVCHCPASNAYLGSGLFPLRRHWALGIPVLIGTDVGAGTNFSLLSELAEVFKIQQLQRFRLDAARLLYLGTLAGAEALHLERVTGNLAVGKQADFLVVDPSVDDYLPERLALIDDPAERLFALLLLGGPALITHTHVAGRRVFHRPCRVD